MAGSLAWATKEGGLLTSLVLELSARIVVTIIGQVHRHAFTVYCCVVFVIRGFDTYIYLQESPEDGVSTRIRTVG